MKRRLPLPLPLATPPATTVGDATKTAENNDDHHNKRRTAGRGGPPDWMVTMSIAVVFIIILTAMTILQPQPQHYWKRSGITFLRTFIIPFLRPECLPSGPLPSKLVLQDKDEGALIRGEERTKKAAFHFALTTMYLPRDGPGDWTQTMREMLQVSESNKVNYCEPYHSSPRFNRELEKEYYCRYYNGTQWAEENYYYNNDRQGGATTNNNAALANVQGPERGVWFKPLYLLALMKNLTIQIPSSSSSASADVIDWIVYMDTDSIIVNQDFYLTSLLAGTSAEDALIITRDAEGINSGVFLIRNNPLGRMILDGWTNNNQNGGDGNGNGNGNGNGDLNDPKFGRHNMNDQAFLAQMFDQNGYLLEKYVTTSSTATDTRDSSQSQQQQKQQQQAVKLIPKIKILRQCALQATGGLEASKTNRIWPYFDGAYARGNFAVHFFGRPDKLEQMKLAASGSLGFFS